MSCRDSSRSQRPSQAKTAATTVDPMTGVFTDGSSVPNPGPGGWGAVYVVDGEVVSEASGSDPDTTNNRMELKALVEAVDLVPDGKPTTVYSDSNLAVRTINDCAPAWERRGGTRTNGPVANIERGTAA